MQLPIPGSFPVYNHADGRQDTRPAVPASAPVQAAPEVIETSQPAVPNSRRGNAREVLLGKKLMAAMSGNLAVTGPTAAVSIATGAATAAVRRENVSACAAQSALAAGMELAVGLSISAMTTGLMHHTGLGSRFWSHSTTEKEVLDRTMLTAALLNAGNSMLGGIAYDMTAKAITHHKINHEALVASVVDQAISKALATGVIGTGAVLMYKHNRSFRNIVDNVVQSLQKEIRYRTGSLADRQPPRNTDNPDAAMEEGRASNASVSHNASPDNDIPPRQ